MQVKDIMTTDVKVFPPSATLQEVAKIMSEQDFGFVPIGEDDRLIGAVTDRDVIIRAIAEGKGPETSVRDIISEKIKYCYESDDVEDAAEQMEEAQIRRLVVLNKDKRLTGVISLGDIATRSEDKELSGEVVECVSESERK